MKKVKILVLIFIIFIICLAGFFFFWTSVVNLYTKIYLKLPQFEKGFGDFVMEKIEKEIFTPPPLRSLEDAPESVLARSGIIKWTNSQRAKYGFPPLKENAKLDTSAEAKVEDMFKKQYFSHDSPSGLGVGDLAVKAGYEFLSIGENLALGNFENDEKLVQAWMDSPGHRENILNSKYKEIGVAVFKGSFEGKTTWMAVQHFALPLSACPEADEKIKLEIEADRDQIRELQAKLEELLSEIQEMRKRDPQYNQKIEEYNSLVSQYNALIGETKALIDKYNLQVKLFNECLTTNQ